LGEIGGFEMRYTDTENTGTPTVPFIHSEESAELLEEEVWSHRLE
jgi:hypothetical protein